MVRRIILGMLLIASPTVGLANSLLETFQHGVLGVPWGTTLDQLVGIYPEGDHTFAVTPGCRAYWVKDAQIFLGIPRERSGVLYGLDENNRVAVAAVAFQFERKVQLRGTLISMLGQPTRQYSRGERTAYGWGREGEMVVWVTEFGKPHQQIVWLTIQTAGYKQPTELCR
jgi:hypothetical protein